MATTPAGAGSREPATAGGGGHGSPRSPIVWQGLSALLLLAVGGIHLYLVLNGVGGVLGLLFVLNAVGALVLAVAIVALRRRPLLVASVLSLLFIVGTLLALVLALTMNVHRVTPLVVGPSVGGVRCGRGLVLVVARRGCRGGGCGCCASADTPAAAAPARDDSGDRRRPW